MSQLRKSSLTPQPITPQHLNLFYGCGFHFRCSDFGPGGPSAVCRRNLRDLKGLARIKPFESQVGVGHPKAAITDLRKPATTRSQPRR